MRVYPNPPVEANKSSDKKDQGSGRSQEGGWGDISIHVNYSAIRWMKIRARNVRNEEEDRAVSGTGGVEGGRRDPCAEREGERRSAVSIVIDNGTAGVAES